MTFKEFHILNENKIEDFINSVNNTDLKKELKEVLKSSIIAVQGDKFKININNTDLEKFVNDNKKELGLELDSLKKSSISRDKLIQIVFDGNGKEFNDTIVNTDKSKSGEHKSELNSENSNGGSKQKTDPGDEKIVDNFFANKDFTPIALDYSDKTIEKNFLNSTKSEDDLSDFGILYTAIEKFKIEPEQIDQIKEIAYVLKRHANKDGNDELSLEEYTNAMISISNTSYTIAKEPNIIKFILFLLKIKTKGIDDNVKFNSNTFMTKPKVRANLLSDVNQDKRKSLLYTFFTMKDTSIVPNKENKFGQILSNFKSLIESVNLKLDSVLDSKMTNLKQIDDFVKNPPEAKPEEKKPEKEGLTSRIRGQYLSKRITDNKRNLDRYDRETEKLKEKDDEGKTNSDNSYGYNKTADENQAGKIASKETYGFNIDKPTADEDSINNFKERIKHLIQNDLLNITGALRIKGIAGDRSEANRKNNAISRTWEEAIMRSNNKTLMEGFWKNRKDDLKYALHDATKAIDPRQKFRGLTDNYAGNIFSKSKRIDDNGEYVSNAEERANKIFKYYMQRSNELIGRYVEKMENARIKVETGKTYAQRVNKEWGITKAYYDLLRELFDLKLACRKDCEEGGIAKALKGITREIGERASGDKEYREKNAISNADAVKKMLEKQIVNVKEPNELQRIAKLVLFDILFGGSKTAKAALEKLKTNECFTTLGLENVKDNTKQKTYKTPDELFRAVRVNPEEITEDGLTQLQKSLNRTDCLAQINKFKEENKTKKENVNNNVNAEAAKQMLEKQLLNVQPVNDLQVIAKLCLYNAVFNSKTMDDAVNKINNGSFKDDFEIEKGVKDFSNTTTSGVRINLTKPKKVYYTPAELFRAVGINPKEITSACLEQLQKNLNKEECLEQVNRFKNFYNNIKAKITKVASISFEELFKKNGFIIKEESQETINARNTVANELKNGIDLTDDVKKINLADHSVETTAFKQAIAGNVLLNGVENGQKVYKLFDAVQFEKIKADQLKYKQSIEKDQQQQRQQQQSEDIKNATSAGKKDGSQTEWNYSVTTNAVDSTYGNGYQKQTPQNRMKEIIYKKGNYTVKTRQMI